MQKYIKAYNRGEKTIYPPPTCNAGGRGEVQWFLHDINTSETGVLISEVSRFQGLTFRAAKCPFLI